MRLITLNNKQMKNMEIMVMIMIKKNVLMKITMVYVMLMKNGIDYINVKFKETGLNIQHHMKINSKKKPIIK